MKLTNSKMVNLLTVLILITTAVFNANAQSSINGNQQLQKFIQVWGLIKYRSPLSIAGKFDADSMFLSGVKRIKNLNEVEFDLFLQEMLIMNTKGSNNNSGNNRPNTDPAKFLTKNVDYKWIKRSGFKGPAVDLLDELSKSMNHSGKHPYMNSVAYEPIIPGEEPYDDYEFNSEEMNLLALAKAWNAIEYLFPYKYLTDERWQRTLEKMIPVFKAVNTRAAYEKGILQLEAAINDTHASKFLDGVKTKKEIFNQQYYPPFAYRIFKGNILVEDFLNDSLQHASALNKGDEIIEINGVNMGAWLESRGTLLPASNQVIKNQLLSTNNQGIAYAFADLPGDVLDLKVRRNKRHLNLKLHMLNYSSQTEVSTINTYFHNRYAMEQTIKGYENLDNGIGLIRAAHFFDRDLPSDETSEKDFFEKIHSKKALIFDMRGYPASPGLFYFYLPQALGKEAFAFARYFGADISNSGVFVNSASIETFLSKDIKPKVPLYQGKIVILTDENTLSMSEWFTMMLSQINSNTTILGTQTAGADGDIKTLSLPGNYQFIFSGNGIYYPNGKQTQRIGIIPDIPFELTIDNVLSKEDEQLDQAIEYIKVQ